MLMGTNHTAIDDRELPSLSFLVGLPTLVGFLGEKAKSVLFATDKTVLPRFAIFHSVLAGLAMGLQS